MDVESYVSSLSNRNLRPFLLWFHRSLSRDPWREIKKRKTAWSIRCIVRFTARSSIYEMEEWKIRTPGRYHGITRSRRDASWLLILFLSLSVSRCWPLIRWSGISSTCRENHLSEHLLNNETRRNQRGNRIVSCSSYLHSSSFCAVTLGSWSSRWKTVCRRSSSGIFFLLSTINKKRNYQKNEMPDGPWDTILWKASSVNNPGSSSPLWANNLDLEERKKR